MNLVVTPRQLLVRSEYYHQLGAMLAAGMPVRQSLETLRKSPPSTSLRPGIQNTLLHLEQGFTFTESVMRGDASIPSFDVALIAAGEKSGRLDQCLRLLAEYYRSRAEIIRQAASQCAYPVLILHVAIGLAPIQRLVLQGDVAGYLGVVAAGLLPVYGTVLLLIYLCQGAKGETWRAILEGIWDKVPLLGAARRNLALARLSMSLEALLSAGVPILQSWPLAALASGSTRLRKSTASWMPMAEDQGHPPGEIIAGLGDYPEMFANLYATGEKTGTLDDTLKRLHRHYQEEGMRGMRQVGTWFPRFVYFGILGWVAFSVVRFYVGYFKQLSDVMGK